MNSSVRVFSTSGAPLTASTPLNQLFGVTPAVNRAANPVTFGDDVGDGGDRVAALALALGVDAPMDVEHELGEVDAALTVDANVREEQVHQHRLAAADAAPEVHAAGGNGAAAEQTALLRTFELLR